jgi:hypothetical protein
VEQTVPNRTVVEEVKAEPVSESDVEFDFNQDVNE